MGEVTTNIILNQFKIDYTSKIDQMFTKCSSAFDKSQKGNLLKRKIYHYVFTMRIKRFNGLTDEYERNMRDLKSLLDTSNDHKSVNSKFFNLSEETCDDLNEMLNRNRDLCNEVSSLNRQLKKAYQIK